MQKNVKVGDAVTSHIQVQSKSETGEWKKLSYQSQGPLQVKTFLGNKSYEVQCYNEPSFAIRKYKSTYLYLLPLAIFLHESVKTVNLNFCNIHKQT